MHSLEVMPPRLDVEKLRGLVRNALRSRERAMALIGVTIRRMVAAGAELTRAKGEIGHGAFAEWLAGCGIVGDEEGQVSYPTVTRWMRLAQFAALRPGDLDKAQTVTQAYRLAGILPEIETQSSGGDGNGSGSVIVQLAKVERSLTMQLAARPIEQWASEDRALLRQRLEPLVELFEKL